MLPNTINWVHWLFGFSLRDSSALYSELLANPPRTGFHMADGIHLCMMVISQFVWALVWTYPRNEMESEFSDTPSGRAPENMDAS